MLPIVVPKLPAPFSFIPMPLSPLFPLRIRVLSHLLPSSIQSKAKYSFMENEQRAKDFQDFKYRSVTGGRIDGEGISDLIIPHLLKLLGFFPNSFFYLIRLLFLYCFVFFFSFISGSDTDRVRRRGTLKSTLRMRHSRIR